MLKIFKLQFISDGNVNNKISHKNYLRLFQVNPCWKPSLRKFDLSCGMEMYNFEGLLQCEKQNSLKNVTFCKICSKIILIQNNSNNFNLHRNGVLVFIMILSL